MNYDTQIALLTCPVSDICPGGGIEEMVVVRQDNRYSGFSDQWGWYKYPHSSVCKFRVFSPDEGNLLIELDFMDEDVERATLMIMERESWQYPADVFTLSPADIGRVWNVSAVTYEYWLYFMPSTERGGSYRVNVELEELYMPPEDEWESVFSEEARDEQSIVSDGQTVIRYDAPNDEQQVILP